MAIASDKTKEYLQMLEEKFNMSKFNEFIKDLLNLENENIIDGKSQKATSEQYKNYIDTAQLYARYEDSKRRKIGVIVIKLQDNKHPANARTMQRNYIAHLLDAYNLDATLSAIYSDTDDTWRLSFVKQEIDFSDGKLKSKFTPAKRYSYLFGKDEPNHTAKEQLLELLEKNDKKYSIEEIEEKFSVEKVTKDFFENYKENYLKLKETLESNEEFISESKRCDFTSEEFTKKLMGQIVFIYFLQKKGWLGVKIVPQIMSISDYEEIYEKSDVIQKKILDKYYITFNNAKKIKKELLEKYNENKQEIENLSDLFVNTKFDCKWGTGEKRFIRTIFENCINRNKNFFDNYLEPFFYDGLNHKRKNQYFSLFNCKIPFLNGGLFEPLDNYQWQIAKFNIKNDIFSNEEETGILDFFDRYNFTMNEEEPLEKDVAVDPEMLGKIFENLLDVKDRKSKGAFYTPREIVHYMCQESIANFLVNKVGVDYNEIKEFIQYGEMIRDIDMKEATKDSYLVGKTVFKNIVKIDNALEHIKIADPAVGSGAFPLGILNEIVKIRDILTSYMLIYNRLGLFGKKYKEEQITDYKRSIYQLKWNTIKNSIYAVDIENSAVDITKLRLWLSIVVDQTDDPEPLPNLNCKIMQGNSLIDEYAGIKLIDKKFIDELKDRENVTFNDGGKVKSGRKMIDVASNQIQFGDGQKKAQIDDLINLKQELYGENDPERKKVLLERISIARNELLKLNFIGTNKEKELLEIDKSHNKPYFAWMLEFIEVFIENDGFDIVIGNPPYVGESGNKDIFRPIAKTDFGKKFYMGKMDLLYFFFHKSLDISNQYAEIALITTNYFITADGALKLRKDIKERAFIRRLINFNETKVFDTARGQHNSITFLTKNKNDDINCETTISNFKGNADSEKIKNILNGIDDNIIRKSLKQGNIFEGNQYYIRLQGVHSTNGKNSIESILDKISNYPGLGEMCNVNQGVVTGCDTLTKKYVQEFGMDKSKINDGIYVLDLNNPRDAEKIRELGEERKILRDFYKNSDIKKWVSEEIPSKKLIYFQGNLDENKYPKVYKHLLEFKPILEKRLVTYNEKYHWTSIHRSRDENIFTGEKIVVPYRSKKNTFAYNNVEWFCRSDVYIITTKNNTNIKLKVLLAILNSTPYYIWLSYKGKKKGEILELFQKPLLEVPIVSLSKEDETQIEKIVNEIIEELRTNNVVTDKESEIDKIIYRALKLNAEEVKILEDLKNERS